MSRWTLLGAGALLVGLVAFVTTRARSGAPPLPPARWELAATPTVLIGETPDAPVGFLGPITTLFRTSDSTIAEHSWAGTKFRIISLSGHLIGEVGGMPPRYGPARPGEFVQLAWAGLLQDTLFYYDDYLRRLTAVSPNGQVYGVRSWTENAPRLAAAVPIGRFTSGNWALMVPRPSAKSPAAVVRRDTMTLVRAGNRASGPVTLRSVLGPAVLRLGTDTGAKEVPQMFGPRTHVAVLGHEIWVGDNAEPILIALDSMGGERRRIVLPVSAEPIGDEAVKIALADEERLAPTPAAVARVAERYQRLYLPKTAPYFTSLLVSRDSLLWVELWVPRPLGEHRYLVYHPGGQLLATVQAPPGFRITDAGRDWVLGTQSNAMVEGYEDLSLHPGARMYMLRRN